MAPVLGIYLVWLAWALLWIALSLWTAPNIKRESVAVDVVYRLTMFIGFVLLFGFYSNGYDLHHRFWDLLRDGPGWSCVIVVGLAMFVSAWARVQMGSQWSGSITLKAEHHLVTEGPYAVVRHPVYAATMSAALATAMLQGVPTAFMGAGLLSACWCLKALREEQFLREELGPNEYDDYAKRVPMFVPLRRSFARWPKQLLLRYLQHI